MFGIYDIPLKIEGEGISISIQKEGETFLYTRECLDEKIRKTLLTSGGKILLNPVEPLNKPKPITPYLFAEFESTLVVEPKITKIVFLKFPVEIGAYIASNKDFQSLDVFTLTRQKYTLYGDPRNGFVCKHFKSDVYSSLPSGDPLREGVMELTITNTNPDWVELTKAVFSAYGMKIYYNNNMVSLKASMKIKSGDIAETDFEDSPLEEGMNNSLEIYTARKLTIGSPKFVMEFGI